MTQYIMPSKHNQPDGALLLRTLAMPSDTNANGDIFGGWIMSQMDIGGGILAKEITKGRTVTVAVNDMTFVKPISVGDVVCCYGKCLKVGRSSLQIKIEVWAKKVASEPISEHYYVAEAIFIFVAVDKNNKPREIPKKNNPELEQALLGMICQ